MTTSTNNNVLGTIGTFTAPIRPENTEKRGKGRPVGSVSVKAELTIRANVLQTVNGYFSYDINEGTFVLNGPVHIYSIYDLKDTAQQLETIGKLPPCHSETKNKYISLLFGEVTDNKKREAAENIIKRFYSSDAVYAAWLRLKTGEVEPRMTRTLTPEEIKAAEDELMASLK